MTVSRYKSGVTLQNPEVLFRLTGLLIRQHGLSGLASYRRSVSQGAAQKTAHGKNKKSAARGSERTPVGKLNLISLGEIC